MRQIALYEAGKTNTGEPIDATAWHRYRLVCAGIMAGLEFDWRRVKCGDVTINADEWN